MAKKRRKKTNTPSARRQKQLLATKKGANGNLYKVTASNVKASEVKWMATTINRRLRAIEKAGLQESSNEYNIIQKYATGEPNGKGSIYNVNWETGAIRITSSTRGMTGEEKAYLITTMRNILKSKTFTVRGTKQAKMKAWKTFLKTADLDQEQLSFDKYNEMWKLFRQNVDPDRKDHLASQAVVRILKDTNFYEMTLNDMERSFQYLATSESPSEWIDSPFGEEKIKLEYI